MFRHGILFLTVVVALNVPVLAAALANDRQMLAVDDETAMSLKGGQDDSYEKGCAQYLATVPCPPTEFDCEGGKKTCPVHVLLEKGKGTWAKDKTRTSISTQAFCSVCGKDCGTASLFDKYATCAKLPTP